MTTAFGTKTGFLVVGIANIRQSMVTAGLKVATYTCGPAHGKGTSR